MSDKVFITAPIAKTVETPDGGREVWGFATLERKDKTGEIADFDGTVKAFEKWSGEIEKRTQGKSKGNVRLMHGATVAGKAIHWEPTETTVQDESGNDQTVKAIWTGAYVPPTKPDIIKDIDEGILSAFSIGGSYAKRWWDDANKAFRYIPELSEYSLVDNPAVPGADITQVIAKADGPWNKENRNLGGESVSEELEKKAKKPEGSYEELSDRLQSACETKFKQPGQNFWDGYVVATFPDHVIVRDWTNNAYWDIPYTMDDQGAISLGDPSQVDRVESYVPVETMKMIKATEDERKKLHDEAEARAKKYGIGFKEGKGHLTPPKDKPTDAEEYGDPVNYAYPIDSSHIKAAVSYFNQDGQREDGGYTEEEWSKIGKRIAAAAKKHEGGDYAFKDGKIETPAEKPKGSEKSVTAEELQKAAEAAGVSMDQLLAVFKALNPEETTQAPTNVTTVDGDGDGDHNREFPNPPTGDEKVNIEEGQKEVQTSEKETMEGKGDGGGDLEKSGKAISKSRMTHLHHAMHHIKAAMDGTDYGPEHHLQIENDTAGDGPNSGLEAPEVTSKAFTSMLNKSVGDFVSTELSKALQAVKSDVEALVKGLPSVETVDELKKQVEGMAEMVKAIHDTPQPGGVVLGKGSPDVLQIWKASQGDTNQMTDDQLVELVKSIKDPYDRDRISQTISKRQMAGVFGNGGNA